MQQRAETELQLQLPCLSSPFHVLRKVGKVHVECIKDKSRCSSGNFKLENIIQKTPDIFSFNENKLCFSNIYFQTFKPWRSRSQKGRIKSKFTKT